MEALLGGTLRRRAILLLAVVVIVAMTLSLVPTSLSGHSTKNPLAIHMAHAKKKHEKEDKGKDKKKDK